MLCCAIWGAVGHCMLRLLTKHQSLQRKNNGVMMIERLSLRFTSLAMALLLAGCAVGPDYQRPAVDRSEEHTSELQSLMRTSYAVFSLKKKTLVCLKHKTIIRYNQQPSALR